MPKAYLFLGSNIDPIPHLKQGFKHIKNSFEVLKHTPIYSTRSTVTAEFCFYNMAMLIRSESSKEALNNTLRSIESQCGRVRVADKNADRSLDIDISIFQNSDQCCLYPADNDLYQRHFMAKIFSILDPHSYIAPLKQSFSDLLKTFQQHQTQDINLQNPIIIGEST